MTFVEVTGFFFWTVVTGFLADWMEVTGFLFNWRALACAVLAGIFLVPMGWGAMMFVDGLGLGSQELLGDTDSFNREFDDVFERRG